MSTAFAVIEVPSWGLMVIQANWELLREFRLAVSDVQNQSFFL